MRNKYFIGRQEEQEILADALASHESEMVAVIGRRRVGKTFLVNTVYEKNIIFEVTGLQNAPKKEQLENFVIHLGNASGAAFPIQTPQNWLQAFNLLTNWLDTQDLSKKPVVFFDELPWISTRKSGFLRAFGSFWNSWAVKKNIVVVICGSAASWMIQKVVNNKGGLYNRVTKRIYLAPFTLAETEEYLAARSMSFNRYQITQLYMALGGIPHHLKEIKKGKSATQNINQICFSKNGLLRTEFPRLYSSLFADAEHHVAIIRVLSKKQHGLTQKEIVKLAKTPQGGSTTRALEELEYSGFISAYRPHGKQIRGKIYRLTDEYSLFYLKFIDQLDYEGKDTWHHLSQTQTYKTWSGYAFENICLKHVPQIKKALSIAGIYSVTSTFYAQNNKNENGAQIDLVIDRKDDVITLFEIKFYKEIYALTKKYAENLKNKKAVFKTISRTNKQLFFVFITPFGLKNNEYSDDLIAQTLTLDDLFLNE